MRVLQLLKTSTGASWALRQMRELVKLGVEVHVALPTDGPLIPKYKEAGVIVHDIDFSLKYFFQTAKRLKEIVGEVNPDIIHSHFVVTTLLMRLVLRTDKTPRIFQVPGPLHLENWFFRNLELALRQKNDYWVGSCLWTNERYRKSGIQEDKIFLSYYGGDIQNDSDYKVGKLKKDLGLRSDDILVGIVAYMYAPKRFLGQKRGLKGHEDLIDAIALLKDKYPNLYCVCIGGAWGGATQYEQNVKDYAQNKAEGRIFFTGTIPMVTEVYNDLFCVIHPSHSENLGGAAESLLLGVPTITSNVGGFPDIVVHGETGLIVPPNNPKAIAQAISDLISGKYDIEEIIQNGKARTIGMLNVKETANSMFKIYYEIFKCTNTFLKG